MGDTDKRKSGFWRIVLRRYAKSKLGIAALVFIAVFVFTAVFAVFLANDKPIFAALNGRAYFPILFDYSEFHGVENYERFIKKNKGFAVFPPVRKSPFETDIYYRLTEPSFNEEYKKLSFICPLKDYNTFKDRSLLNGVFKSPSIEAQAFENVKMGFYSKSSAVSSNIEVLKESGAKNIRVDENDIIRFSHPMGTDSLGRDILSRVIHGSTSSFIVGTIATFISLVIGLFFGMLSGYFGDDGAKVSLLRVILNVACAGLSIVLFVRFGIGGKLIELFHVNYNPGYENINFFTLVLSFLNFVKTAILLLVSVLAPLVLLNLILNFFPSAKVFSVRMTFPVDSIVSRFIEIVICFPSFFIILAIISIVQPNVIMLALIMGSFGWTGVARLVRGEFLRIKNMDYVNAARVIGVPDTAIILRHILPNALTPVLIYISFGIASAILGEASLSFLGFGVPAPSPSWGQIMENAVNYIDKYWLIVFPGMAIFISSLQFNITGEIFRDALDPKSKL